MSALLAMASSPPLVPSSPPPPRSTRNPVTLLAHDHGHFSQMVRELVATIPLLAQGSWSSEQHQSFQESLLTLRDDLLDHCAKEEEGLFPFLERVRPDLTPQVRQLAEGHDALSGLVTRLLFVAQRGSQELLGSHSSVETMLQRLSESYEQHAKAETAFLQGLALDLSEEQKTELAVLLRSL